MGGSSRDRKDLRWRLSGRAPSMSSTALTVRLQGCTLSVDSSLPQSTQLLQDARPKTLRHRHRHSLTAEVEDGSEVPSGHDSDQLLTSDCWTTPSDPCCPPPRKRPRHPERGKTTWDWSTGRWTWTNAALRDRPRRSTTDAISILHSDISARLSSLTALALKFEVKRREDRVCDMTTSLPALTWCEAAR